MRASPVDPADVADLVVERVLALGRRWCRVAIDGAPATEPGRLASEVAARLPGCGRPAVVVPAEGFLRPASLRFERGREDPDAYYEDRLDERALAREVLDRLEPGNRQEKGNRHEKGNRQETGSFLPSLWDAERDRATREPYVVAPPGLVVVVPGDLLLGRWLAFDLTVHLALSPAALARRTPEAERWTLPAFERYADEVDPVATADLALRVDDPRHPAVVDAA